MIRFVLTAVLTVLVSAASAYSAAREVRPELVALFHGHIDELADLDEDLCGTNEILEDQGVDWACIATPGGGVSIILDLGDDDSFESLALSKIAITGDLNNIFTEPLADKLLIDAGQNWPTADFVAGGGFGAAADLDANGEVANNSHDHTNLTITTENFTVEGAWDIGTLEQFADSDATPDVSDGSYWKTSTVPFTITDFDGVGLVNGQVMALRSISNTVFDCTSTPLRCGTTDIATTANDMTFWVFDTGIWYLISFIDHDENVAAARNPLGVDLSSVDAKITFSNAGPFTFESTSGGTKTMTFDMRTTNKIVIRGTQTQFDIAHNFLNTGYMQFKMRWINSGLATATLPNSYTKQQWSRFTNPGVVSMTLAGASAGFYGCFVDGDATEELRIRADPTDAIHVGGVSIGTNWLCNDPAGTNSQVLDDYVCFIARTSTDWILTDRRGTWDDCGA